MAPGMFPIPCRNYLVYNIALVTGADAVVHIAGLINAATRAGFEAVNVGGTLAMVDAARGAGVRRFIHISSLAAREPDLSDYSWSKARAVNARIARDR